MTYQNDTESKKVGETKQKYDEIKILISELKQYMTLSSLVNLNDTEIFYIFFLNLSCIQKHFFLS